MDRSVVSEFEKHIVGYTDKLSVVAGDTQQFMLSCNHNVTAKTSLVRLICGDVRARGAGFREETLDSDLQSETDLSFQPLHNGSYGAVNNVPTADSMRISFHFYPTLLSSKADQTLVSLGDFCLVIRDKKLYISVNGADHKIECQLRDRRWHWIEVAVDGSSAKGLIRTTPIGPSERSLESRFSVLLPVQIAVRPVTLALAARITDGHHQCCFNGKLEAVTLSGDNQVLGEWRFEHEISGDHIVDVSGNKRHGSLFNSPVRATRGHNWDGSIQNYSDNPAHYAAIHFHATDLTDAKWKPSITWTVPDDLASGQYALKVEGGNEVDYIPFFVRPASHHVKKTVAYLAPTASYIAYANHRLNFDGFFASTVQNENDAFTRDHPEIGLSLYDHHSDGSGVHYSSHLRPVLNLRPRGTMWCFNADTNITAWLEHEEIEFDVVTDEDLHREGQTLLQDYQVVITGTHPEYYSTRMRDGLEGYLSHGGRLMYMGGNGFYWKIAYHPDSSSTIEVRRAEDGTRAWIAEAGEYYQSFDGELGGMWRRSHLPPNQLVGIGFTAQGFDGGTYYRKTPSAEDPRAAFIFEGTSGDEVFGGYGSIEGGAASQEIDRWDPKLGSPEHALVIATSENHRPGMLRVIEEMAMTQPNLQGSIVRADMTFFETAAGGAVFSTGSIGYAGALAHQNYENDVNRLTTNILKRFMNPAPFEYPVESA